MCYEIKKINQSKLFWVKTACLSFSLKIVSQETVCSLVAKKKGKSKSCNFKL